jgi:septum formation topological specificity factor MinE
MTEDYVKIPLVKVIELILMEERNKIRKHYLETLGKPTSDVMDTYVIEDCEILKILKCEN